MAKLTGQNTFVIKELGQSIWLTVSQEQRLKG